MRMFELKFDWSSELMLIDEIEIEQIVRENKEHIEYIRYVGNYIKFLDENKT